MTRVVALLTAILGLVFSELSFASANTIVVSVRNSAIEIDGKPFFPILTWAQCASDVEENLALQVNLFLSTSCNEEDLVSAIAGRAYVAPDYGTPANQDFPNLIGYVLPDEPDGYRILPSALPKTQRVSQTDRLIFETLTAHFADEQAPLPEISKTAYPAYIANADVIGFDLYPLAHFCGNPWISMGSIYDEQRDLIRLAAGKPTYQWIEVNALDGLCGPNPVGPAAVRAEVFLAIAGGATGIGYFTHGWPENLWQHFYVSPEVKAVITTTNEEIQSLSPVLLGEQLSIRSDPRDSIKLGGRSFEGLIYFIAVNATPNPVQWQHRLPGLNKQLVSVYNEGRSLKPRNGRLTDTFGAYGVHIYVFRSEQTRHPPRDSSINYV